eukprot:TRINITY_DN39158_c0_g1_i1.p1 TRINITY_DN39158_c0_g1~~TRINITY_DN39158_c0_g1_i1.p1  ORF type:complete len:357 (+),score=135.21 TRINITY_DN39158_c0_g1_i1:59-1072(+)
MKRAASPKGAPLKQQRCDVTEPGKHIGFGKVILFGEHVVVHSLPAVVCAVKEFTDCTVVRTPGKPGLSLTDNRPAVPGYKTEKRAEQKEAHDLVVKHLKVDLSKDGVHVTLGGPLVPTSGIGASASDVCSLSRALSDAFDLKLDDDAVNYSAWVGEGGYHGTPSGIDNTAATFGGLLSFRRTATPGKPDFRKLETGGEGAFLVVVSTGITASTTKVVGEVRSRKDADSAWWDGKVSAPYQEIYDKAVKAIHGGDWATVGELMNANHALCRDELKLSIPQLERIVETARGAGALGAKLSGTGRGGIAIALCRTTEQQQCVAAAVRKLPEAKYVWEYSL